MHRCVRDTRPTLDRNICHGTMTQGPERFQMLPAHTSALRYSITALTWVPFVYIASSMFLILQMPPFGLLRLLSLACKVLALELSTLALSPGQTLEGRLPSSLFVRPSIFAQRGFLQQDGARWLWSWPSVSKGGNVWRPWKLHIPVSPCLGNLVMLLGDSNSCRK